jgi:hypothetical protein
MAAKMTQQAADRAEAAVKTAVHRHDALSQRGDAGVCARGASTASHGSPRLWWLVQIQSVQIRRGYWLGRPRR